MHTRRLDSSDFLTMTSSPAPFFQEQLSVGSVVNTLWTGLAKHRKARLLPRKDSPQDLRLRRCQRTSKGLLVRIQRRSKKNETSEITKRALTQELRDVPHRGGNILTPQCASHKPNMSNIESSVKSLRELFCHVMGDVVLAKIALFGRWKLFRRDIKPCHLIGFLFSMGRFGQAFC